MYVVKMDGMKVRSFTNRTYDEVAKWAKAHCRGKWCVVSLVDCGRLPDASSRIYPNEDLPGLVYKPFVAVG